MLIMPPSARTASASSPDKTARVWDVSDIPPGDILQVACADLKAHDSPGPVSLDNVTDSPLTLDRPICETDPPPPDQQAPAPVTPQ